MAILSEVVKQETDADRPAIATRLASIADTARGLVGTMSDIVWAIDPARDTLDNVVSRVRQFAAETLDPKKISWEFHISSGLEAFKLTPDQRRHLFLIFKEAITNVARHAQCAHVLLDLTVRGDVLVAEIRDDGQGFESISGPALPGDAVRGRGLSNMQSRAAALDGRANIQSSPGAGTRILVEVPL